MDQDEIVFRLVLLLVVIAWSIWNAVLARQRGRGPIRWLLASLVISPMLVTIVLALLKLPRKNTQFNMRMRPPFKDMVEKAATAESPHLR